MIPEFHFCLKVHVAITAYIFSTFLCKHLCLNSGISHALASVSGTSPSFSDDEDEGPVGFSFLKGINFDYIFFLSSSIFVSLMSCSVET